MKEPKRVQKAINTLDQMLEWLHYYMGDCKEFKEFVRKDILALEDLLKELSVDQKLQNIRLAKKLKAIWESQQQDSETN